ncbi:MAG: thioredoxin family protein [Acidobacteriota bacterium]
MDSRQLKTPTGLHSTKWRVWLGTWTVAGLLIAASALAERLPGDAPIGDFERTKDWIVEVDGVDVPASEVFYSAYEVAWLLQVPEHGALLVSPRGDSVQRVEERAVSKSAGLDASMETVRSHDLVAELRSSRGVMSFDLEGQAFRIKPAPPVLGRRSSADLDDRHPAFEQKSMAYRSRASGRAAPVEKSAADDLMIRVYFGSWSPVCDRIVPKIMAVEEAWGHIRFEYYGLPKHVPDDPHAVDAGITGVPTVVVLRGGEEVERLTGRQLDRPEVALGGALGRP